MKILMVSRWFWEERRRNGGKPGFVGELVQAIAAKGIDLTILSQAEDAGLPPEPRPVDGLDVHVFSGKARKPLLALLDKGIKLWGGYRKAATDAAVIRRFARDHGPFDAVVAQCEEPDGLACALAVLAGKMPPLITQVHDLRYRLKGPRLRFIRKSSLGFVFQKSARVVANSELTATWLNCKYGVPERKIGQCRIHLTTPFLDLAARQTGGLAEAERRILFLGALNYKKAPDTFLCAAIALSSDLPDWKFVLVGPETTENPEFFKALRKMSANPLIADRVEWLGRLEPAAVIDQVRRARVAVCPSRIEAFSRTTVEALALGRPVIVTETTGAANWVRSSGCGSVVPPHDYKALALAIRDWTTRETIPDASAKVTAELTVDLAADDWIREAKSAIEDVSG
jgi:glycosyltransferase involved in cell wall biosynthesis